MTLFRRKAAVTITLLSFLLMGSAAAQTAAASASSPAAKPATRQAAARPKHHGVSKPSPVVPEPPTPAPAPPPTPAQLPPTAPQVTYTNGLLTIVASNSTLSDILRAVASRTGATVDAPAQLTSERVAAHIGPASPREVLSDLLTGPRFDYILVGSDGDPNGVRNIILTPNQSSTGAGASVAMAQPAPSPMPAPAADQEDDDDEQAQTGTPESPPPGRMQASPGRRQFVQPQPPDQVAQPTGGGEGGGPQQQIKTPEQLLEQLRKMQQQPPPSQQPVNDQR